MFVIYIADVLGRRLVLSRFQLRGSFCQAADSWASCLEPNVPAGDLLPADIAESSVAAAIPEDLPNLPPNRALAFRMPTRHGARIAKRMAEYRCLVDSGREGWPTTCRPASTRSATSPTSSRRRLTWMPRPSTRTCPTGVRAAGSADPVSRDAAVGGGSRRRGQLWNEGEPDEDVDHTEDIDIGNLMMGFAPRPGPGADPPLDRPAPNPHRARGRGSRPPLLCMLAWLNCALGHRTQAGRHVDGALAIAYPMAQLLGSIFASGVLPDWRIADPGV
ncbi:MAG: hypothetical protein H7288_01955 [Kineosporiaceae bacterium]|nr:hypothetical protein [Aeromicrobium sp.]